jgi:hypothetical protein
MDFDFDDAPPEFNIDEEILNEELYNEELYEQEYIPEEPPSHQESSVVQNISQNTVTVAERDTSLLSRYLFTKILS